MSRSGYTDDCEDQWALIRWRGAVNSAIKGKRGQAFLRETLAALDAMPVKELIDESLVADGQFCTLGVVGAARGMKIADIDPEDRAGVAGAFKISEAMAAEIMYENDEFRRTPVGPVRLEAIRWHHMRQWIASQILPAKIGSTT